MGDRLPAHQRARAVRPRRLVVFFRLADASAGSRAVEDVLSGLRDRAVLATDVSFTISDPGLPDNPLVWVNPAFTRITGYGFDEAAGRNCRFLQGPATDRRRCGRCGRRWTAHQSITVTLLNYRKDGTAFWNEVSVSPVFDGDGGSPTSSACRPTSPPGCRPRPSARRHTGRPSGRRAGWPCWPG